MTERKFVSGEVYRYASSKDPSEFFEEEGLKGNFFEVTHLSGGNKVLLDRGIWAVSGADVAPVIMISSSFHNKGAADNPWRDVFEPDMGFVKYFGDAKSSGNPAEKSGNKTLLREFDLHTSGDPEIRKLATPMVFFERVEHSGVKKGYVRFAGFGVIESAELVTQFNPVNGYFSNYIFNFAILSLAYENEEFDWGWINARRLNDPDHMKYAPHSWKAWLKGGNSNLGSYRRKVVRHRVFNVPDQMPTKGTRNSQILDQVYDFYTNFSTKHRFELLASRIVMSYLMSRGLKYDSGWVTQGSGDGGVDFVGKLVIGDGISQIDVIVLGQAKCESPAKPTGSKDLARTVARLKRGWIGAYVTTSFFSEPSQNEMFEDQYPLLKLPGAVVAEEVIKLMESSGFKSVKDFLVDLDSQYPASISRQKPEDLLNASRGIKVDPTK